MILILSKGQTVYYTRIFPSLGVYDVVDLKIRTAEEQWFCGTDKRSKQAFIFNNTDLDNVIFIDRNDALKYIKEAEKHKTKCSTEIYYEEY